MTRTDSPAVQSLHSLIALMQIAPTSNDGLSRGEVTLDYVPGENDLGTVFDLLVEANPHLGRDAIADAMADVLRDGMEVLIAAIDAKVSRL